MLASHERSTVPTNSAKLPETVTALRDGETDLSTHVDVLCDRIDEVDPEVEAFLPETDRRARLKTAAGRLRKRFPDPADRPPLYGATVGVKDVFHVEGFPTRAGGSVPPELFGGPEATVVEAFREAGALVAGKTVSTEFAMSAPGPTRNPHDLDHTPGGSSSGSAAAVAAGLCPLAVGTQTNGSVIRPAAFCGVVGYKPSFGRIPTGGLVTLSQSADHVGLFAQDVDGMELAASVACRSWTDATPDGRPTLGVVDGPYFDQASPEARDALDASVASLEAAGYEVTRATAFDDIEAVNRQQTTLTAGEITLNLGSWLKGHEGTFRPITADRIREGYDVTAEELVEARDSRLAVREALAARMDEEGVDLWVSPAAPGPAPEGIDDTGDPVMNKPWTHAGVPVVTLPSGTVDGLPVGTQFAAPYMADERLLAWAESLAAAL
jgi:Asp-tRNA(Asn)/Glu-tRNA(Gln) amidotransferase A subunit family amidase